jgi:peptide/nickel transport system substrate-binding protein
MAALESGWERAGFDISLQPIAKDYFTAVSAPSRARQSDVIWANWAADWPSASTIIPPLFDSRANLSPAGAGRNYGHLSDPKVNERMDAIAAMPDAAARDRAWAALDATLVRRGVYVALAQHRALYVAGSGVEGLAVNDALGGYVDLAAVEVR